MELKLPPKTLSPTKPFRVTDPNQPTDSLQKDPYPGMAMLLLSYSTAYESGG